ncbi:hypothetical protein WS81_23820 [Burkholderia sp. MSMB2040]|nr:hypothetical protein WS78_03525 [Burkholderia savannae]KVG46512.1 hypothetical protein WS77_05695 [Burkholderia sp. MSMB0265]KVG88962.1 hypothetical protein WS81_23820 [Burkholderia sp. MSMB2040]KVH02271.1 hypothetical protein WS82_21385 [Burkholderia sp. MSMB2041]KVK74454.1 hypothetical protein WS91_17980 [Burkholderia sp. MSMB1498]
MGMGFDLRRGERFGRTAQPEAACFVKVGMAQIPTDTADMSARKRAARRGRVERHDVPELGMLNE